MSTQMISFPFNGNVVRAFSIDGEPAFVGKDVCERLGYANPNKAMNDHCKGVTKRYPLQTPGGVQKLRVLGEPDVLRLIVKSTLPEAVEFEKLVFEEILPSIRRTGGWGNDSSSLLAPLTARVEELATRLDQALTSYDPSAAFTTVHRPMLYFVQKAAVPSKGRGPLIRTMSRRCSTWMIRNNLGSKIRHSRDQERHLFDVEATEHWLQIEGNGMIRSHLDKVLGQNALHLPDPRKAKRKAGSPPFAKKPEAVS